ncbi:MAG: M67 family metallopeptidase [bacterium]
MLRINERDEQEIRQIAECIYPYECCGFLIGDSKEGKKSVGKIVIAENHRHDSPANRFLITPEQFQEIESDLLSSDQEIIGFFHSHPDCEAQPSAYDLDHAWPWYSYVIVSVKDGLSDRFTSWILEDDRSSFREEPVELADFCESKTG